jgi:hypothetical protein
VWVSVKPFHQWRNHSWWFPDQGSEDNTTVKAEKEKKKQNRKKMNKKNKKNKKNKTFKKKEVRNKEQDYNDWGMPMQENEGRHQGWFT